MHNNTAARTPCVLGLVFIFGVLLLAAPAGAQTQADNTVTPAHEDSWSLCPEVRLLDNSPSVGFPVSLPPGEYEVMISVGDAYDDRPYAMIEHQNREQVRVVFHTDVGEVATGPTPDLIDGVAVAEWQGSLGRVTIDSVTNGIVIAHIGPNTGGANSLNVHCVSVYRVVEIPMFSPMPAAVLTAVGVIGFHRKRGRS